MPRRAGIGSLLMPHLDPDASEPLFRQLYGELRQAILFHRVGASFADLQGCVAAIGEPLEHLARTAVRQKPSKDNLFAAVTYDRSAWERVMQGIELWQRRPTLGSSSAPTT